MGTGYTRADVSNGIASGKIINASDFDAEYDAIEAAFDSATGHTHDGTSAEGGVITVIGPAQDYVGGVGDFSPKTTATYDLGTSSLRWGVGYLTSINVSGNSTLTGNVTVGGTVDGRDIAADGTKLDGIEALADVTDTTNVTAAGALMDSEVASLSGVKTLTVPNNTTISTFGATVVDDTSASAVRTTIAAAGTGAANVFTASQTIQKAGDANLTIKATSSGASNDDDAQVWLDCAETGEVEISIRHEGVEKASMIWGPTTDEFNITTVNPGSFIDIQPEGTQIGRFSATGLAVTGVMAASGAVTGSNLFAQSQTWQDVKASRAVNTIYQNTTGRPIQVWIYASESASSGLFADVSSDNFVSNSVAVGSPGVNGEFKSIYFVVPDNYYYRLLQSTSVTISKWSELR